MIEAWQKGYTFSAPDNNNVKTRYMSVWSIEFGGCWFLAGFIECEKDDNDIPIYAGYVARKCKTKNDEQIMFCRSDSLGVVKMQMVKYYGLEVNWKTK